VSSERPHLTQLLRYDAGNAADRSRSFISGAPVSRDGIAKIEAFDGFGEVAHEVAAAEFPIGENLKTKLFLFREHAGDVLILEGTQLLGVPGRLPCFQQVRRPQETSNMIGAVRCRHSI
jgi:hypothetical protein